MKWMARHVLGLSLTDVQHHRLKQRMGELAARERWSSLLNLVPGAAALIMIPFWIRLARHFPLAWRFTFEVTFAACAIVYVFWLWRRRYTRHGWRALRDLGLADVCVRCGYDLGRQPQPEGTCPECGERFSQFHPDRTWPTDQP